MGENIGKARARMAAPLLALALAIAAALGAAGQAWAAADAPSLDFGQEGSISLTLADADGAAVSGGEVTLYQVASLYLNDGDMAYEAVEAFAGFDGDLDAEDADLAESLAAYAQENGVSGTEAAVGSDGTVSFGGLELGLYLVVQEEASDGCEAFSPFVVTVPLAESGAWSYAVDASPKVGALVAAAEEEPAPSEEDPGTDVTETGAAETPVASTLPQTGQLNWPVPALACLGALLVAAGLALGRTGAKRPGGAA